MDDFTCCLCGRLCSSGQSCSDGGVVCDECCDRLLDEEDD